MKRVIAATAVVMGAWSVILSLEKSDAGVGQGKPPVPGIVSPAVSPLPRAPVPPLSDAARRALFAKELGRALSPGERIEPYYRLTPRNLIVPERGSLRLDGRIVYWPDIDHLVMYNVPGREASVATAVIQSSVPEAVYLVDFCLGWESPHFEAKFELIQTFPRIVNFIMPGVRSPLSGSVPRYRANGHVTIIIQCHFVGAHTIHLRCQNEQISVGLASVEVTKLTR